MIDYIKREVKLKPVSFDDMELLQSHLIEQDYEALCEQVSLLFGISYEKPIDDTAGASQVDA